MRRPSTVLIVLATLFVAAAGGLVWTFARRAAPPTVPPRSTIADRSSQPLDPPWDDSDADVFLSDPRQLSSSTSTDGGGAAQLQAMLKEPRRPAPPEGWKPFLMAVTYLEEGGDRSMAATRFEEIVRLYPNSAYAADSRELATHLRGMVEEDRRWREPRDVRSLPLADQIEYHVYHLRDVQGGQLSQPGMCSVFVAEDNAALRLREIGEPAIPRLIGLLHDRRPIRSVGCWRDFHPSRIVLRYQDAAVQILQDLIPVDIGAPSGGFDYLSVLPDEYREDVIAKTIRWWTHTDRAGVPP